ncbi:helix-turn-helix domain-containing protein [Streptomyces albogriseolus]
MARPGLSTRMVVRDQQVRGAAPPRETRLTSWCVRAGEASCPAGGMIRRWRHLARLVAELAVLGHAGLEGRRHAARWGQKAGRGCRHPLPVGVVDRLVATLIHLRHDLPHAVLGLLFGVDRSTITCAIAEVRTLLAGTSTR